MILRGKSEHFWWNPHFYAVNGTVDVQSGPAPERRLGNHCFTSEPGLGFAAKDRLQEHFRSKTVGAASVVVIRLSCSERICVKNTTTTLLNTGYGLAENREFSPRRPAQVRAPSGAVWRILRKGASRCLSGGASGSRPFHAAEPSRQAGKAHED